MTTQEAIQKFRIRLIDLQRQLADIQFEFDKFCMEIPIKEPSTKFVSTGNLKVTTPLHYSNYRVVKSIDNKYICECVIQDGTERWPKLTLDEAIESLIKAAKVLNGMEITVKDIQIL